MTWFDLRDVTAAQYSRLAHDAEGAAFRAKLGAGSPSVMPAEALRRGSPPVRPIAVFRAGAVGGASMDMRTVTATWWLYDDPAQRYARINDLLQDLRAAYREDAIAWGRTEISGIGPETFDDTLGLVGRSVTITHYRRG